LLTFLHSVTTCSHTEYTAEG